MKTIKLYKTDKCWMAENLVNGKPDTSIIALFGTHMLPTPFTSNASADIVIKRVSDLNPGSKVELN